jgi:hypothetical protein
MLEYHLSERTPALQELGIGFDVPAMQSIVPFLQFVVLGPKGHL